jgi:hypothetical protein
MHHAPSNILFAQTSLSISLQNTINTQFRFILMPRHGPI